MWVRQEVSSKQRLRDSGSFHIMSLPSWSLLHPIMGMWEREREIQEITKPLNLRTPEEIWGARNREEELDIPDSVPSLITAVLLLLVSQISI